MAAPGTCVLGNAAAAPSDTIGRRRRGLMRRSSGLRSPCYRSNPGAPPWPLIRRPPVPANPGRAYRQTRLRPGTRLAAYHLRPNGRHPKGPTSGRSPRANGARRRRGSSHRVSGRLLRPVHNSRKPSGRRHPSSNRKPSGRRHPFSSRRANGVSSRLASGRRNLPDNHRKVNGAASSRRANGRRRPHSHRKVSGAASSRRANGQRLPDSSRGDSRASGRRRRRRQARTSGHQRSSRGGASPV